MILVVLGMHKSGTTLVSQILHSSGINMGAFDPAIHYDHGNKYERADSLALDMDILGTESHDVLDLSIDDDYELSPSQQDQMQSLIRNCEADHDDWGMKDPRMCLTYRLWNENLPPHKLIVVYREPAQVWPRFKWWGKRGLVTNFRRAYAYLRLWIDHNRSILNAIRDSSCPRIVLSYHDLMTDDAEFERLRTFVGHDLVDSRKPELYRSTSQPDFYLRLARWVLEKRTGLRASETLVELQDLRAREIMDSLTSQ